MQYLLEYKDWVSSQEIPVNEDFGDWSHLLVDVTSAIADSIVPGSGAAIDVIHSISYWVQSSLTNDPIEKLALDLQGVITLGSVVAIGVFQATAVAFKAEIKTIVEAFRKGANSSTINLAKKSANSAAKHAKTILSLIKDLSMWLGKKIKSLKGSDLGSWLIQKFGTLDSALEAVNKFITVQVPNSINKFLGLLAKLNPTGIGSSGSGEIGELGLKTVAKKYTKSATSNSATTSIVQTTNATNSQIASTNKIKSKNTV